MFISFEGGEGSGKTTLIARIAEHLERSGHSVLKTRAPGGTSIGALIRDILLHKENMQLCSRAELLLFLADRSQHVDEVIVPSLKEGKTVLCDRFNDSTLAYQSGGRGFNEEWIQKMCLFATDSLEPDLTFFLDVLPEVGLSRVMRSKDRIEEESLFFHQKIRQSYLHLASKNAKRFRVLDASKTPDEVYVQAVKEISCFRS